MAKKAKKAKAKPKAKPRKAHKSKAKKSVSKQVVLQPIRVPALKPVTRPSIDVNEVQKVEDEIRDLMNWVAVFEKEYDLPKEVVETLHSKLHNIAQRIGWLKCQ